MRRLFTTDDATKQGLTRAALRWGEHRGRWRHVAREVYADGPDEPDAVDWARARVLTTGGAARGRLAAVMHRLDGVDEPDARPLRRRELADDRVVVIGGIRCADGLQTLVDLAADLDDLRWEQALECALRKRLTTVAALEASLAELCRSRTNGTARIRRVLALRPDDALPTESLLETLMVQLARTVDGLSDPVRQYTVVDEHGSFVARLDLAWPELGLFLELDGQHHAGQPVYDARRETAVVAATGWLPGRFTWREVVHVPRSTARRLAALASRAAERGRGAA
jgi:hypothetical protein